MAYVDLRERRDGERGGSGAKRRGSVRVPHLLLFAGSILAVPAIVAFYSTLAQASDRWIPSLILVSAAVLLLWGARSLGRPRRRSSRRGTPDFGAEKSLLLAIRDSGGAITAVGAALETPLTVDEADEILSKLANDGHLRVESHDGTLYYVLPDGLPPHGPLGRR